MLRAPRGLLLAVLAPPGCGRPAALPTARLAPADTPRPPPASPPASCDPLPDDATTASSTTAASPHHVPHTPAAAALAVYRCGIAADQIAHRAVRPHRLPAAPASPLQHSAWPAAIPPAPARASLPTPPPSAECRAVR